MENNNLWIIKEGLYLHINEAKYIVKILNKNKPKLFLKAWDYWNSRKEQIIKKLENIENGK